jgi:hypothetical protein
MPQQQPSQLELSEGGLYETPAVQAVLGPAIFRNELPTRLILRLQGGTELRVPIDRLVLKELRDRLDKYLGDKT